MCVMTSRAYRDGSASRVFVCNQVKQRALTLAEMTAFVQRRHEEDEQLKNDIEELEEEINRYLFIFTVRPCSECCKHTEQFNVTMLLFAYVFSSYRIFYLRRKL
jgi:hypothetical protein